MTYLQKSALALLVSTTFLFLSAQEVCPKDDPIVKEQDAHIDGNHKYGVVIYGGKAYDGSDDGPDYSLFTLNPDDPAVQELARRYHIINPMLPEGLSLSEALFVPANWIK